MVHRREPTTGEESLYQDPDDGDQAFWEMVGETRATLAEEERRLRRRNSDP